MKNYSSNLLILFIFSFLFLGFIPNTAQAALVNPPPVEKKKAKQSKKEAKMDKRLLKRQAKMKKITDDGYGPMLAAIFIIFGLSVFALTGIILLIIGLASANPVLWIVGLCLMGAAILIFLIWYLAALLKD